jgi:hypothetical protein
MDAFMGLLKKPPCANPLRSPDTDAEMLERTLAILQRRNIYGVASGPLTEQWTKAAGGRIIPGLFFNLMPDDPKVEQMTEMFRSGRYAVLGEIGIQYQGMEPGDARMEPYWAMAEKLDVPVGIHIGTGPPGAPYFPGSGAYRARLHSLLVLEEVLVRHPKLRVYAMHAGWPMLDDALAVLWAHPQLYVDVGVISYAIPRAAFHSYLRAIVEAGFGKRVLFGSDQMVWPEAIEASMESIETANFLSAEQKRDILYNNAARFLRLSAEEMARQRAGR